MMDPLNEQSEPILRKDKEWSLIDGELCQVTDFLPLMESAVKDGIVISPVAIAPYASITLKCAKTTKKIKGFITHKIDFANLWAAFKERGINEEKEEVLIYWSIKHYKYKLYQALSDFMLTLIGGTPMPKIIVMICPKGTYKSCECFRLLPKKQVLVFVYGLMSLKWWMPDVIK